MSFQETFLSYALPVLSLRKEEKNKTFKKIFFHIPSASTTSMNK